MNTEFSKFSTIVDAIFTWETRDSGTLQCKMQNVECKMARSFTLAFLDLAWSN